MVCSMFSRSNKHHRNRGFRSSSSVIGCEASYLHHGSSNFEDIKEEVAATGEMASASEARASHGATVDLSSTEPQGHHQHHQQTRLETHSCPSSPTETDCSSGFSTLRRRSVTVTEKVSWVSTSLKIQQLLNNCRHEPVIQITVTFFVMPNFLLGVGSNLSKKIFFFHNLLRIFNQGSVYSWGAFVHYNY